MISVDFKERSTWRGVVMSVTGLFALSLTLPIIVEMFNATTTEHLQFLGLKSTIIGAAIGLTGQTVSGLIGIIFNDKGA